MPTRQLQLANPYQKYTLAVMGDSLTLNTASGIPADAYWGEVLAWLLRSQGCKIKCKNYGISGDTTLRMLERIGALGQWSIPNLVLNAAGNVMTGARGMTTEVPDCLVIWGGTNDPTPTLTPTGTTDGTTAVITSVSSTTGVQAGAPISGGGIPTNSTVLSFTSNTITISANTTGAHAAETLTIGQIIQGTTINLGSNLLAPTPATASTPNHLAAMIQTALNLGVPKIMVMGQHYLDYQTPLSNGGDVVANTSGVPGGGGTCQYASIIASQYAAATWTGYLNSNNASIVFCDLFTYIKLVLTASAPASGPGLNQVAGNQLTAAFPRYVTAPTLLSASNYPMPLAPTTYTLSSSGSTNSDSSPTMASQGRGYGIQLASSANVHQNELGLILAANAALAVMAAQTPPWPTSWYR